jgi:branched-subunit amino acid aminotransferase/4-amino-4-deoxychorismate lyase
MAGFEGIKWAGSQARYTLHDKAFAMVPMADKVPAVSRSIHYGICLAFEGIRYFVGPAEDGSLSIQFLNLHMNLRRFRRSIAFNLGSNQHDLVPSEEELEALILHYLRSPELREFITAMGETGGQGYLRPFTVDESQSIGVTFPERPAIRMVTCTYDRYMDEPFSGVVVPNLVRAVAANGTGNLKLGINYLLSIKAVDEARSILPEASSALFLDDRMDLPLRDRRITEWDSSCCLIALADGRAMKIPESPLILPSVTIQGICAILREEGITVEERDITYGEFMAWAEAGEIAAIASIGTAGILNRAQRLMLVDENNAPCCEMRAQSDHPMYHALGRARQTYWDIYRDKAPVPEGMTLQSYLV